jgi:hypothetical protein
MTLKTVITAFSVSMAIVGPCLITGCKGDRDKNAGQAGSTNVTPKDVAANPGDVPQPASPPAPTDAGNPTKPRDAASVAGKRESAGGLSWETPAGWSMGAEVPMRLATLTDGTAEIAISAFPGNVGGTLMNVNRWRGQLGLTPLASEADAEAAMGTADVSGRKVRTLDLSNNGQRMLVAVVPGEGRLYFVKLSAPADVAAARKGVFDQFVKTIRVE